MSEAQNIVSAAILVIGDEILSGRTKDKNIGYIADYLTSIGIDLSEVRIVPDVEDDIVAAVNALRARYTYVFTTGGIGPTHDDITADAIAKAFGVDIVEDQRAIDMMLERYAVTELTPARRRMARIPVGASLIANPVSKAPGFVLGNVIVMAGVPAVMQAMLDNVAPSLSTGIKMLAESIDARGLTEGRYGAGLGEIAKACTDASFGSYPALKDGTFHNQIVVRARDPDALARGKAAVEALLDALQAGV